MPPGSVRCAAGFDMAEGRGGGADGRAGLGGGEAGVMLRLPMSAVGGDGKVGEVGDLDSVITGRGCQRWGRGRGEEVGRHTSVHVSLFSQFVVRVAVRVNRAVELLECHEGCDKLVVGVQETAEPLLGLDVLDLHRIAD